MDAARSIHEGAGGGQAAVACEVAQVAAFAVAEYI